MESMDAISSAQKSTELTPASIPSTPEVPPSPSSNLNPNPNSISNSNQNPQSSAPLQQQQQQQQQQPTLQHSQTRPPINRPWPQPPFTQFSPLPSSSSASLMPSSSLPASSSISTTPFQRGGLAIGVPAHHVRPSQQSTPFSSFGASHFNQQYGGLAQNSVGVPDPLANSTSTQVRQPIQGIQSMGVMGSLGSRRPGGVLSQQQQRPIHSLVRSQSPSTNPSLATQKFQGHGLIRAPSVSSPGSPSPGTPQSLQSHPQTWMSTGSQGKQMHPSLSSPLYRSQMKPESLQQRSHIPQQHHQLSTASHQQQMTSAQQQQQPSQSHQSQEHYGQQYPRPRAPHSVPHQQHVTRGQGSGYQKFPSLAQPSTIQPGPHNAAASADAGECSGQILGKRSIHELVSQIDPCEKLDPEVEDILVELADEFIDSITTFGCSLAKHRKSATLEAKDILLHLERNWNMTFPGFGGDEIKIYKKPSANDIHKERIAAIKKSVIGIEAANSKSSVGQAGGNVKGHTAKAPTTGSPKSRQVP